jgi:putative tricarboxylic transport membrane protein
MKKLALWVWVSLLLSGLTGGISLAASYPDKAMEFIAPASPGGGWDLTCRSSAKVLQETKMVPVPITVFNKPGGLGAVVFNDIVRNRRTDDYVLIAFSSVLTSQLALRNIKATYKDITPIASLVVDYGVLAVKKDSPYKDLKSILSAMKQNPASVSWAGSSAPGGLDHFKLCLLAQSYGIAPKDVRYVAFQGGAEALASLLGGHVAGFVGDAGEIAAHSEAGTVLPLVILSSQRLGGIYRNVPTAKELGLDVVSGNWRGFYGPPEMSKEARAYWEKTLGLMVKEPGWKKVMEQNAWLELFQTGETLRAFIDKELANQDKILRDLGIIK